MPMYYRYSDEAAWKAKDQYLFGSQLLVCPITSPADKKLNLARANVWLPEGRWTDIFTGRIYKGGRWVPMYRDLDAIPVLAKEGAIVPMYRTGESNDLSAQRPLDIHIWRGNGQFDLYEDDGETMEYASGKSAVTRFEVREDEKGLIFTVAPPADSFGLLPKERTLRILFRDIKNAVSDDEVCTYEDSKCYTVAVTVADAPVTVRLTDIRVARNADQDALRSSLLTRYQGYNLVKSILFKHPSTLPGSIKGAMKEIKHLL